MSTRSFSKYVHKAEKKLAQLEKKQGLRPVLIEGSILARTWWGKAWNENLESYAEYATTLGRGRSIVQGGAVLDLQVSVGEIKALVQGSRAKPYGITITIKKLNKNTWNLVASACEGKLESSAALLTGTFPKTVKETFMQRKTGLFPSPREIAFACSCPDWANMCKHIAATLYGVGARLDEDPTLFFALRGVDPAGLITGALPGKAEDLLRKTSQKSSRTSEGLDIGVTSGSSSSADVAAAKLPDEESVRMADVRKILKKQLKMDAKLAKKEKLSKKSLAKKKDVKQNAQGIVERVVKKQFRFGMNS